ncbi:hypothetical protein TrVE_jg994 [Triparma verrucosa]|uniref:Uncharacterized protein n=1 Tax=Triparma verrucosa TaxID=1606542 RepID=A0A9W7ESX1_9STRA|nr:hypothetical protein TrVE_jg994 [Triparma verrucosa]
MATDIVMIRRYHDQGRKGFAKAIIATICASLLLQSFFVYIQNRRKKSTRKKIVEQIFVWTLVKPGIDAYRIAYKAPNEVGQAVTPHTEATVVRCIEMLIEAVPNAAIQLAAILGANGDRSFLAMISLFSSLSTGAFLSAVTSYEWDTNREQRRKNPLFYGYVPEGTFAKLNTFVALFMLSYFNLLVRSTWVILLPLKVGSLTTLAALSSEMIIYFIWKGARKDFSSFFRLRGVPGVMFAFVYTFFSKGVADWTGMVHLRFPHSLGGMYFSFNVFINASIGLWVALTYNSEGVEGALEKKTVLVVLCGSCAFLLLSYAYLLGSLNRDYINTFFSTKTSSKYLQETFTLNVEDELKFFIFRYNEQKWKKEIGEQVKVWLNEKLVEWAEEPPEWLTEYKKSIIPEWAVDDIKKYPSIFAKNNKRRNSLLG